ncbi:vanin-like protein 1 [Galleria mellonella]|uniref:Vanin-like protein 1 n=1 Tax=Galleria mellonella TaxID=7137 RepID=A0A6J1WE42_GALME|nr:vanin-like protein 1 [Galleria mellonella]
MRLLINVVICFLCCNLSLASDTYRAGVVSSIRSDPGRYVSYIKQAAKLNVDILVFPPPDESSFETMTSVSDDYDEVVKTLSEATKQARLYVVAHLYETVRCQNVNVTIRSNLVFDREGSIISEYRKPVNNITNCTSVETDFGVFKTDFNVTFGLLMEEDLVLRSPEAFKGLKNFVMTGTWTTEIPYLSASKFSSSWAFVNKANLVSPDGISDDTHMLMSGGLKFTDLYKRVGEDMAFKVPVVHLRKQRIFLGKDLPHYVTKPMNLEASRDGYEETVCHDSFCCEFYIKTRFVGSKSIDADYVLAAFRGTRYFGHGQHIGIESCAVFTNSSQKCFCSTENENNAIGLAFDKVTVIGNFTNGNSNYPIALSTGEQFEAKQFSFVSEFAGNTEQVVVELKFIESLTGFGIVSRDFSKDFVSVRDMESSYKNNFDIYDYIFHENVLEFFDYVWIRLRILIFVVSIYILEMI